MGNLPDEGRKLVPAQTLPVNNFEETLRSVSLKSLADDGDKCGRFTLFATLRGNTDSGIVEFESLDFEKPCLDNPGLRLKVTRNSNKVRRSLKIGSQNPFQIIGVESISIENVAEACTTQDIGSCNQTDLQVDKYLLILH